MTMKSIKSWIERVLGKSRREKAGVPITLSDPQALKRLQRATEDLERLVKFEKDGRNKRDLLEERLDVVHRRDIYNAKKIKQAEKENHRLVKRIDRIMVSDGSYDAKQEAIAALRAKLEPTSVELAKQQIKESQPDLNDIGDHDA